jgi:hypothetical protein
MTINLCTFKNSLGEPKKGIHSYRLTFANNDKFNYKLKVTSTESTGIAIVDLVFTIIAAIILAILLQQNFFLVFTTLMIVGVFLHILFCVDTTMTLSIKDFFNKTKAVFGV